MWGLWFVPLLVLSFAVGVLWSFVRVATRRPEGAGGWLVVLALPFALPALFIALFIGGILAGRASVPSDAEFYREVYGRPTDLGEDAMLAADFGEGPTREIWMRIEADPRQARAALEIPGLEPSSLAPENFKALGEARGLMWWLEPDSPSVPYPCLKPVIRQASDAMGWHSIVTAECAAEPEGTQAIYLVARGRL